MKNIYAARCICKYMASPFLWASLASSTLVPIITSLLGGKSKSGPPVPKKDPVRRPKPVKRKSKPYKYRYREPELSHRIKYTGNHRVLR